MLLTMLRRHIIIKSKSRCGCNRVFYVMSETRDAQDDSLIEVYGMYVVQGKERPLFAQRIERMATNDEINEALKQKKLGRGSS